MRRATIVLAAGTLVVLLSACGTNNITGSFVTPAITASVPTVTATTTSIPTATPTATAVAPTAPVAALRW